MNVMSTIFKGLLGAVDGDQMKELASHKHSVTANKTRE